MPGKPAANYRRSVCVYCLILYTVYMQQVTVGRVLALDLFRHNTPRLISQPVPRAVDEPVRWMHILETARPEGLLPGGEFILTTATFLDRNADSQSDGIAAANKFLDSIEATGAVAVVAEVLPDRVHVATALSTAAQHRTTPIYLLDQRIRFVELTQFVHETIAAARLQEVETDRRIHEAFTKLSVGSASISRIVAEATALLGCQVVWEPLERQTNTATMAEHQVVAGDEALGRLLITDTSQAETSLVQTVLERAGQAVVISVLALRSQQEMRRSTASSLFYQLRGGTELSAQEVQWRLTDTFGYTPVTATAWQPVVFRIWNQRHPEELLNRWSGVLLDILENLGSVQQVPVFAARSEIGVVDVLVPARSATAIQELITATDQRFTSRVRGRSQLVAGIAAQTDTAKAAAEHLVDAAQIAHAAEAYVKATGRHRSYFYAKDLGLRGLLATLQSDEHLIAFIATELAGLIEQQPNRQAFEQQLEFVEAVITADNKASLARTLHMSRPALYARIKRAETQLNYSLELDVEQRTATHLAIMAYRLNPEHMYRQLKR